MTADPAASARAGPVVGGTVDHRFAGVRDAFVRNFTEHGEVGAAVCITVDGRTVVDLWAGWADAARTVPWGPDTLVDVFSVGKGLVALLAARLVGTGAVDLDAPVARVWPAFAAADKDAVTLRMLLAHTAGLPAIRRRLPPGALYDWRRLTDALAAEAPWWEPGTAHGYHVNTFGLLVGEVVRRVTGRSVRRLLAEDVAGPLGADVHVGVPPSVAPGQVAELLWEVTAAPEEEPPGLDEGERMRFNAYFNPSGLSGFGVVNTPGWRRAVLPSANVHASARGIARVYTALASAAGRPGGARGDAVVDPGALREATTEQACGPDLVLERPSRFGLGFQLTQPERPLGPGPGGFGHFGAGGALGFADPDSGVAVGYAMNAFGPRWQNPRNRALVDAAFRALDGR